MEIGERYTQVTDYQAKVPEGTMQMFRREGRNVRLEREIQE